MNTRGFLVHNNIGRCNMYYWDVRKLIVVINVIIAVIGMVASAFQSRLIIKKNKKTVIFLSSFTALLIGCGTIGSALQVAGITRKQKVLKEQISGLRDLVMYQEKK